MATHSSVLAWRSPGTGEPDGLPSMGSHRVGHDWSDLAAAAAIHSHGSPTCTHVSPYPEPPSHLPSHSIPLGCPRAPALGVLLHALTLHWSSILHMVIYTGVGDGQGGLACCDSWSHKELDTTEQLNWTELNWTIKFLKGRNTSIFSLGTTGLWHWESKFSSQMYFVWLESIYRNRSKYIWKLNT